MLFGLCSLVLPKRQRSEPLESMNDEDLDSPLVKNGLYFHTSPETHIYVKQTAWNRCTQMFTVNPLQAVYSTTKPHRDGILPETVNSKR